MPDNILQQLQQDIAYWAGRINTIPMFNANPILEAIHSKLSPMTDEAMREQFMSARTLAIHIPEQNRQRLEAAQALAREAQTIENIERLHQIKQDIEDLHKKIQENQQLLERCAIFVNHPNPSQYLDHWFELANIILERQDAYGFQGVIDYRDAHTKRTPGTGLEGQSVAYGALLQPNEFVRYTLPNTKLQIEHHASGKIIDNSTYVDNKEDSPDDKERNLAALKCAKLLLMDCARRQETTIFISGPPSSAYQAQRVLRALAMLAQEIEYPVQFSTQVQGWSETIFSNPKEPHGEQKLDNSLKGLFLKEESTVFKNRLSKLVKGETLITPHNLTVSTEDPAVDLEITRGVNPRVFRG